MLFRYDSRQADLMADPLRDIRAVGPHKPLGSLPLDAVRLFGGNVARVRTEAIEKGQFTQVVTGRMFRQPETSLFVAEPKALGRLLHRKRRVLQREGWPTQIDGFIKNVANQVVPDGTELYDVVSDAYGETRETNHLRRDSIPFFVRMRNDYFPHGFSRRALLNQLLLGR